MTLYFYFKYLIYLLCQYYSSRSYSQLVEPTKFSYLMIRHPSPVGLVTSHSVSVIIYI